MQKLQKFNKKFFGKFFTWKRDMIGFYHIGTSPKNCLIEPKKSLNLLSYIQNYIKLIKMSKWNVILQRSKFLESRLEGYVSKFSSISQKINADLLCDEENPLMDDHNSEEQELRNDIEKDLNELATSISDMKKCNIDNNNSSSSGLGSKHMQDALIKRYSEIHYDYTNEFRNTLTAINRKRESMELFNSSKKSNNDEQDSSVAKLLRERSGIAASMKSINDVIAQAFDTKNALSSQRSTLSNARGGLSSLAASVPGIGGLIDGIQRKKNKDNIILAIVIAILVIFTLWWVFLR